MDTRDTRASGWQAYSGIVLALGGVFAVVHGLMAVYRSTFFANDAVFVFSDLNTWGWIIFSLGVLGIASGFAVFSGREWARWTGIAVAALGALGQMMVAQAYPLWSLMITGMYLLAVYGLAVYGVRDSAATGSVSRGETTISETSRGQSGISEVSDRDRRAA
jgi:hypothetical protein